MDRNEKIKLLKNISEGIASLDTLKDKHFKIKVGYTHPDGTRKDTQYFINGIEVSHEKFLEEDAFSRKKNKGKEDKITVKIVSYGEYEEE